MNFQKLTVGTIVGGIAFLLLGWLTFTHLLFDFLTHNPGKIGLIGRKEPELVYLIAGNLIQGLLFAWVILKTGSNSIGGGLVTGAVLAFLSFAAMDIVMYATSITLSKKGMAADILAMTVIGAVAGALIGAVTSGKKQ